MTETTEMTAHPPHLDDPRLDPVRLRIAELRSRIRRRFLLVGSLRLLATFLGLAIASFGFDRLLDLPIAVRSVFLVGAIVLLVVATVRRIVRPLTVALDDEELARALEARWPDLQDRFISALQFSRQLRDPENEESPELIHAMIDETAALARERRFDTGLSTRSLRQAAMAFAALLLAAAVTAAGFSDMVGIWARRALLADEPWPRATTLVVLDIDPEQPFVVTRGDDLTILVEARGEVPEDVRVHFRTLGDDGVEDVRRMYRLPETENRFQFEFREIPRSFRFAVSGGDDDDEEPEYTVRALVPPSVESIAARCTYPRYTGLPTETLDVGDMEVPVGTEIDLSITTNTLVRSATFAREDEDGVPLEVRASRRYGIRFRVGQSFQYVLLLEGPEGQPNRIDLDTYRVTAVPDRRPEIRLLAPTARDAVSPGGLIPLKVLAKDNYGVADLRLAYRVGLAGEVREQAVRNAVPPTGREVVAFDPQEVSSLRNAEGRAPQTGDLLLLRIVGTDNNGLSDRTPEIRIEIAAPDEIERRLGQRQISLKEDAGSAETAQKKAHRVVELLLAEAVPGQPLDRVAVDRLRDTQILQGRVGRRMEEFLGGIQRVLNGYVFNRLGNPLASQALLDIYLRDLAEDRTDLSRVYKPRLYAEIVAAFRRGDVFDPEILGILIQIIEVSTEISTEHSPRAHRLVAALVRNQSPDPAPALRDVAQIQAAALSRFAALMNMMKRWETYHEFVVRMREIEDLQDQIIKRALKSVDGR